MDPSSLFLLLCFPAALALEPLGSGCSEAGKGSSCPEEMDQSLERVELLQWQDGVRLVQEGEAEAARPPKASTELRLRAAMCTHARALAMQAPLGSKTHVKDVVMLARMTAHPLSFSLQAQGCTFFGQQISRDSGEEIAPYLTAMDDAVGRALAAEPANLTTAQTCLSAIVPPAVFNRPYTLMLNRTTHTMSHIIAMLREFPDNRNLQERWLEAIAGTASCVAPELTPSVQALGGFDVLFHALDHYKNDPDVMMSAWRGLSDHSHNPYGAAIIANHGGPMKGIEFVVNQLRIHPEAYLAESPWDHLTLKYEIMQIANGILQNDPSGTYASSFISSGFIPQAVHAMAVEPNLRGTQNVACECFLSLLAHNSGAARALDQSGAAQLVSAAIRRFEGERDETPWCGTTLGAAYPVVPACTAVLGQLQISGLQGKHWRMNRRMTA